MEGAGEQPMASLTAPPPQLLGIVKGFGRSSELERTPDTSANSFTFQTGEPRPREGQGRTQRHTVSLWQREDQHPGFHCAQWTLGKARGLGRASGRPGPSPSFR